MNKILLSVAEKIAIEEGIDEAFDDVKNGRSEEINLENMDEIISRSIQGE